MARAPTAQSLVRRWTEILLARARGEMAGRAVERRWRERRSPAKPHGLPGRLIISLTSLRRRFRSLHCSLKCLLDQSVAADAVILWLSETDLAQLPANVTSLRPAGLTIRTTADIGSYCKIIPALEAFPDAYIVTADDDAYYGHRWLEELVREVRLGERQVICHRAHGVRMGADGLPLPYVQWEYELRRPEASRRVFPTGVGGVLYPPGIFHRDVLDPSLYRTLCPTADDLWLYWMALRGGATFRKVGPRRPMSLWPGSQRVNLSQINVLRQGNDRQIGNLVTRFEFPGL
jgi:hypothetical protein